MSGNESSLAYLTDVHLRVQKLRVATGNRVAHLGHQARTDARAEHIHSIAVSLEEVTEGYIAEDFTSHPAYPWLSRIKGCGKEAAAKVVGLVEGVHFSSTDRVGIEAFDTPSKLRRFAGLAPVNGQSEKPVKGQKGLHYNPELRMMLWRLLTSLMRAKGVWYEKYQENDNYYMERCRSQGVKVIPTPAGRYCLQCDAEKRVPQTTMSCPDCGERLSLKKEGEGIMFRGHIVNMAKRRTIRLFLDLLWVVWREAEGLPTRTPYSVEYLGHHLITPEEMVDRR